ncbi:MAG: hypothetical protein ACLFTK_11270, partial [Anaerolineales bacterium]
MAPDARGFLLFGALLLLAIQLISFASVWDLTIERADYWFLPYQGVRILEQGDWFYPHANRQFTFLGLSLAEFLLPHRLQGLHYLHIATLWWAAVGMMMIVTWLRPAYASWGLVLGIVFLLYFPSNRNFVMMWLYPYAFSLMLIVWGAVLLLIAARLGAWRAVGVGILAAVLAYLASRSYEGLNPLLYIIPGLLWLAGERGRKSLGLALGWWGATSIGFAQFLIPFLSGDDIVEYQTRRRNPEESVSLADVRLETERFLEKSFPLERIAETPLDARFQTVLLLVVFACGWWLLMRRYRHLIALPSLAHLGLMALLGAGIIALAGAPFIYANIAELDRAQFFAGPGIGLVWLALAGVVVTVLARSLSIQPARSLGVLCGLGLLLGGQWHADTNAFWVRWVPSFDERVQFFREMTSLAPALEADTLVLTLACHDTTTPPAYVQDVDMTFGFGYVYEQYTGRAVDIGRLNDQPYTEHGVAIHIPYPESRDGMMARTTTSAGFNYDQLVVVECAPEGL